MAYAIVKIDANTHARVLQTHEKYSDARLQFSSILEKYSQDSEWDVSIINSRNFVATKGNNIEYQIEKI